MKPWYTLRSEISNLHFSHVTPAFIDRLRLYSDNIGHVCLESSNLSHGRRAVCVDVVPHGHIVRNQGEVKYTVHGNEVLLR